MRHLTLAVGAAAVVASVGIAGQVDISRLGPQVGERVPSLGLTDHLGRSQTLTSIAGPKGTMLVFFRSADW